MKQHWKTDIYDILTDVRDWVKFEWIINCIDYLRYEVFYVWENHKL